MSGVMSEVLKRRPVLGRLAIAAFGLTVLAVSSWSVSELVSADFPQRPVWDLGSAGPWVASYARAVAAGSWGAARVCLTLAVVVLVLRAVLLLLDMIRGIAGRSGRSVT
ncbi:hypothetical protein [Streptomyces sp. NPDC006863]|uniref:hypothetical protein n=1 Tax=Streptomyces sp. NPDC006863 TaxID=3154779 RepID=UPI003402306B